MKWKERSVCGTDPSRGYGWLILNPGAYFNLTYSYCARVKTTCIQPHSLKIPVSRQVYGSDHSIQHQANNTYIRFSSAMCIRRSVCCAKNLHIYELMNEIFHCAWSQHHKYGNRYCQHPTDFSEIHRQGWCTHIQESSCVCAYRGDGSLFVWYILSDIFSFDCIKRGNSNRQTNSCGRRVLIQFYAKLEFARNVY